MAKRSFSKLRSYFWMFNRIVHQLNAAAHCTPVTLAEDMEVDPRTVRRHIQTLKELGAPIAYDRVEKRYQLQDPCWRLPANFFLTTEELESMALALHLLEPLVPDPFAQNMGNLLAKLLDALSTEDREDIERTSQQVTFMPVPVRSKGGEHVRPLWQAIRHQATVCMSYHIQSKRRETHRRFDPYHLRYFSGCWYVMGYDHHTGHWPVFSLARIRQLTITQDPYIPKAFNARQYFPNTLGIIVGGTPKPVRIRLTGRAAETAHEKIWPDGFSCQADGPDAIILTGQLSNHGDLLPWIAMQQGDAEILPD